MSPSTETDVRLIGTRGAPVAAPPRVLRENMRMDRACLIDAPILDAIASRWFDWRDEAGHAPDWSVFHALKHPALLPHIMLYEKIDGRYRCGIVGEVAGAQLPIKLAGRFLDEAMPAANLADVTSRLDDALESGLPNFVEKTMAWQIGYDLVSYRALQLPFPGQDGKRSRVLSVMDFRAEAAADLG